MLTKIHEETGAGCFVHTFDKLSGDKMLDDVSAVSHISSR